MVKRMMELVRLRGLLVEEDTAELCRAERAIMRDRAVSCVDMFYLCLKFR